MTKSKRKFLDPEIDKKHQQNFGKKMGMNGLLLHVSIKIIIIQDDVMRGTRG